MPDISKFLSDGMEVSPEGSADEEEKKKLHTEY
jgi:hypothetical protein